MPRRPLEVISANIPQGEELTPYTRSKIVTLYEEGAEIRNILTQLKISKNTIKYTLKTDLCCNKDNTLEYLVGRSKKYIERDK
jgi:hypothetical protein